MPLTAISKWSENCLFCPVLLALSALSALSAVLHHKGGDLSHCLVLVGESWQVCTDRSTLLENKDKPWGLWGCVCSESLYTLSTLIAMRGFFPFLKKTALFPLRGGPGEQTKKQKFWRLLLKAVVNKDLGYRKNGDKKEKLVVVGTPRNKMTGKYKITCFYF